MEVNGEKVGPRAVESNWISRAYRPSYMGSAPVGEPIDPVIIHFPKVSHRPQILTPSGLSLRERILALYHQQGRPQAHLDRVMRMGRV